MDKIGKNPRFIIHKFQKSKNRIFTGKSSKNTAITCFQAIKNAQSRNRTSDTRIFSPLLYQLSYLGIRQIKPFIELRE